MPENERRRLIHLRWLAVVAVLFVQFGFYLDGRTLHRENEASKVDRAEIRRRFDALSDRLERMDKGGAEMSTRIERLEARANP